MHDSLWEDLFKGFMKLVLRPIHHVIVGRHKIRAEKLILVGSSVNIFRIETWDGGQNSVKNISLRKVVCVVKTVIVIRIIGIWMIQLLIKECFLCDLIVTNKHKLVSGRSYNRIHLGSVPNLEKLFHVVNVEYNWKSINIE